MSTHRDGHGEGHGHKHGMPHSTHHDSHIGASTKGHLSDAVGHLEKHPGHGAMSPAMDAGKRPHPKSDAGMPDSHGHGYQK